MASKHWETVSANKVVSLSLSHTSLCKKCNVATKCGLTKLFISELVDPSWPWLGSALQQRLPSQVSAVHLEEDLSSLLRDFNRAASQASNQRLARGKPLEHKCSTIYLLNPRWTSKVATSLASEEHEWSHRDLVTFDPSLTSRPKHPGWFCTRRRWWGGQAVVRSPSLL